MLGGGGEGRAIVLGGNCTEATVQGRGDCPVPLKRYANADLKISLYVWMQIKKYPGNFAFLIQRILGLFTREV